LSPEEEMMAFIDVVNRRHLSLFLPQISRVELFNIPKNPDVFEHL